MTCKKCGNELKDGASAGTAGANEDSTFYFNNLEPGTYEAVLYQSGKQICESVSVNVEEHRYTSVSLPYSQLVTLEGYVYDEEGNLLSGVLVEATMSAGTEQWSDSTQTDNKGYYSLEVYGYGSYMLNYSKTGYEEQENIFEGKDDSDEKSENSYRLYDVILETEILTSLTDEQISFLKKCLGIPENQEVIRYEIGDPWYWDDVEPGIWLVYVTLYTETGSAGADINMKTLEPERTISLYYEY